MNTIEIGKRIPNIKPGNKQGYTIDGWLNRRYTQNFNNRTVEKIKGNLFQFNGDFNLWFKIEDFIDIEMKIGDKLEDYIFPDENVTCYKDNKGTIFSKNGYNLNDYPGKTITDVTDEYFKVSAFTYGWFKKENITKKQINMENKKIIAYKVKDEFEKESETLFKLCKPDTKGGWGQFSFDSNVKDFYKNAGVLDLWFELVYEEEKKLPIINGHKGKVEGDFIIYGSNCAKFHKDFFRKLNDINNYNTTGNRKIESITLGTTQVKITMDQVKQIVQFLNK